MLDPNEMVSMKGTYGSEDSTEEDKTNCSSSSSNNDVKTDTKKTCADCGTTKTPLWRGGPAGPKSLCNACGIRSRKRRRAVVGGAGSQEKKLRKGGGNHNRNPKIGESLKQRLLQLGREVMMMRGSSRKFGEEEQAAVLLMALSYGSVSA